MVVIAFSDKPSETRKTVMKNADDCYATAALLAKAPPIDEDVIKYLIGCSFEEPVEHAPL